MGLLPTQRAPPYCEGQLSPTVRPGDPSPCYLDLIVRVSCPPPPQSSQKTPSCSTGLNWECQLPPDSEARRPCCLGPGDSPPHAVSPSLGLLLQGTSRDRRQQTDAVLWMCLGKMLLPGQRDCLSHSTHPSSGPGLRPGLWFSAVPCKQSQGWPGAVFLPGTSELSAAG